MHLLAHTAVVVLEPDIECSCSIREGWFAARTRILSGIVRSDSAGSSVQCVGVETQVVSGCVVGSEKVCSVSKGLCRPSCSAPKARGYHDLQYLHHQCD